MASGHSGGLPLSRKKERNLAKNRRNVGINQYFTILNNQLGESRDRFTIEIRPPSILSLSF